MLLSMSLSDSDHFMELDIDACFKIKYSITCK